MGEVLNWAKIVDDLMYAGWLLCTLASRFGCSAAQLKDLHIGTVADPKYSIGEPLVRLHESAQRAGLFNPHPKLLGRVPWGNQRECSSVVTRLSMLGLTEAGIGRHIGVTSDVIYAYRNRKSLTPEVTADKLENMLERCERTSLFDIMCPPRDYRISRVLAGKY